MNDIKKIMKRVFLMAGMALAVISVFHTQVSAESTKQTFPCGENVQATLENHRLIVSGKGRMDSGEVCVDNYSYSDEISEVIIKEGVTSIGANAFKQLYGVVKVTIPNTVEDIGEAAFNLCDGLYDIYIPGSVKSIGDRAFAWSSIRKCILNKGLEKIGAKAFEGTKIEQITIPDGIISIEEDAFSQSDLKKVVIPANIDVIAKGAFSGIDNATIYSKNVLIAVGAFGYGSELTVERGSTAEKYAKNHYMTYNYIKHSSVVTFNPNGGTVSKKNKKVISENRYGSLPLPKLKGYKFVGWYTKSVGGKLKKATTVVTTTKNSTLYAHWEKIIVGKCSKPKLTGKYTKQIGVSINSFNGASGYQIRYSLKSNMKSAKVKNTASTIKWLKAVKKNKKYYIQVRAYVKDSTGEKIYGAWSSKAHVKTRK